MGKTPEGQAEFRRPVSAESIGQRHQLHEIEAGDAERAALARRFDLVSLDALRATIRLRRVSRGLIEARGRFVAEVVQSCVVTLEPVPAPLSEEFKVLYTSEPVAPQHEIAVSPDADGPPETIRGGTIDLGEAVVQQMATALDPYPRAPGAGLPDDAPTGRREGGFNPFSVLGEGRKRH